MTQIVGIIRDSGNALLSGALDVRLDAYMLDRSTTPDSILTTQPRTFPIANGVLDITLPESETQNQTYFFEFFAESPNIVFYFPEGGIYSGSTHLHTDGKYYVGDIHEASSKVLFRSVGVTRIKVFDRRVVIPNIAIAEFSNLLPTGVTTDVLDTSIRRLAQLLTGDVQYIESLRGGPQPKGAWDAATYYQKDDFVTYAGSSWLCRATTPIVNIPPTSNPSIWLCIAQKGDSGGTGGQSTAYSSAGWLNQSWAPSAHVLRNIIEQLAKLTDLSGLAPTNSPNFTGNPARSTSPLANDRSQQLTTTGWVGGNFATIDSPSLTGNPSAPTQATTDASGKLATTKFVDDYLRARSFGVLVNAQQLSQVSLVANTWVQIPFGTEVTDTANLFASGNFIASASGLYRFNASLFFAADTALTAADMSLFQLVSGTPTRIGCLLNQPITTSGAVLTGSIDCNLTAGQAYSIRALVASGTNARIVPQTTVISNWLTIERLTLY